jgi:glycine cleavage system H protein
MTMAGGVLLVLLSLPLLAALAMVGRPLLLGAGVVALAVGVGLELFSPSFREWLTFQQEPEMRYSGLRLPTDVALDRAHAWARIAGGEATVGADDLVQSVLGPVEAVELPPTGKQVRQGEPLFRLRRGERGVTLRAPISGRVLQTNAELQADPRRVNASPFAEGWAVRLEAEAPRRERRALRRGNAARAWFRGEVDQLLRSLQPATSVPALPDGGVLVHELYRHIDDATWTKLQATFFDGEPA